MRPLLAIDTAGPVAGVAWVDGARVAVRTERVTRGTEALLPGWIDAVAAEAGGRLADLGGIVVAAGPGAFTGLRVGLAAAGGLALALGVRVWPVQSLVPRALRAGLGGPLLVLLDARKGRVYAGLWEGEALVRGPEDVPPAEAARWARAYRATGEGALVYRAEIEAAGGSVVAHADDPGVACLARAIEGEGLDPTELSARYLRAADAVPRS